MNPLVAVGEQIATVAGVHLRVPRREARRMALRMLQAVQIPDPERRMAALDHIVINTLRNMDAAAECFEALGFTLTPRGYHSLGSINHLMMTPGPYLELIGVPDKGPQRQEILDSGLVETEPV